MAAKMAQSGPDKKDPAANKKFIQMWGVKQNNLKNIDVDIPIGSFTVVCGPSGSGKSSLAFETLYAEGQRRYIESLSNYARQFLGKAPKPDIEGIRNIPPAIAIEQKNTVKTSRSTVGTTTEVLDYIRLLFEKIGQTQCPTYGFNIERESVTDATRKTLDQFAGSRGYVMAPVYKDKRVATGTGLLKLLAQEGFLRIYIPSGAKFERAVPETTKKKASRKSAKAVENPQPNANGTLPSVGYPPCRPAEAAREIGKIIEIKPTSNAKELPSDDFYIVIDRMAFSRDDEGRLADSIGQAYHAAIKFNGEIGGGRATVLTTEGKELCFSEENSCSVCGFIFPPVTSQLFSFNNPVGACAACNGFGNILSIDEAKVIPNPNLSIAEGALHPFNMPSASSDRKLLLGYCKKEKIDVNAPWNKLPRADRERIWNGDDKFFGVVGLFEYLETKKYKMHVRVFLSRYKSPFTCPTCKGARLKPESSYVKIGGFTIHQFSGMTIGELHQAFATVTLTPAQEEVASDILLQIRARLRFLNDVGVEYLTMDRPTKTLSGGEFQRLNLAKQLGMGLSQTLYVLDEPTVGLHPRDNDRLIGILQQLNALGNTLVVVEHDHDVIASSENIIEMGPGSGHLGGEVIYTGRTEDFYSAKNSITAPYLVGNRNTTPDVPHRPVDIDTYKYVIEIKGAKGHNLKNLNVKFPLNRLVTVTGVSGSGKSTLVSRTLYPAIAQALRVEYIAGQPFDEINGLDYVKNVLFIDQSPIGKTARSNPVTYLKVYDAIRAILASTPEAKLRGYNSGTFSLNVDGGRCPVCKGLGYEVIDMMFMDDVMLTCDACDGKKFRTEVLEVTYKDKNINQILDMTVSEAMDFFVAYPNIRKPLSFLKEVGLDYIRLGQSAGTLSGGESQRLKIAREFIQTQQKATLYILDEPTTGLHFREVDMLMKVLSKLVDAGGSVILVEHNLDVIKASDFVIDIGPEAGARGGEIVAQGAPEDIMKSPRSLTGKYLKKGHRPAKKVEKELNP
jgi:excinuclease ABC subunit A